MRRRHLIALATLVLLAVPGRLTAQPLQPTLERVAAAWQRGDVSVIAALGARGGVSIDIDGATVGPVAPRQVTAMLRRVFADRENVSASVNMVREVGGQPAKGYGVISWSTRTRGTTIPERTTVFISFVREDSSWRVAEIRLR